MKYIKLAAIFFIFSVCCFNPAHAFLIRISGINADFNVRGLNQDENGVLSISEMGKVGESNQFAFDIPNEYIAKNKEGEIDLWKSLENWRAQSPRGLGHPFTDTSTGQRIAFFPMTDYYGTPQETPQYLALPFLLERQKSHTNLNIEAANGSKVSTKVPQLALAAKLDALVTQNAVVNCRGNSNRSEECMVCNCANEAWSENHRGRININRTVLRRLQGVDYPNTICGVIWQRSQFSWTLNPSRNYPNMSQKTIRGNMLRECVRASKDAIKEGPWEYDSFYNPKLASPEWARNAVKFHRHQNHRFARLKTFRVDRRNGDKHVRTAIGVSAQGAE